MTLNISDLAEDVRAAVLKASSGEPISIVSDGEEVARIVATPRPGGSATPAPPAKPFPFEELEKLRASIKLKGEPMSETVIKMRREARF